MPAFTFCHQQCIVSVKNSGHLKMYNRVYVFYSWLKIKKKAAWFLSILLVEALDKSGRLDRLPAFF